MKKYILVLMILAMPIAAEAGIVVCHNNGEVTNFRLRGDQVQGCLWLDAGQNVTQQEYERTYDLLKNIERKYLKVINNEVQEKTAQEKTQADTDEAAAQKIADTNEVNRLNVSNEDIITALVQTINKRLTVGQKITKQEIVEAIKAAKGL